MQRTVEYHAIPMNTQIIPDIPRLGARYTTGHAMSRDVTCTVCHTPVCCSAEPGGHLPKPLQGDTNITWTSRGHYVLDMCRICLLYLEHHIWTFCGHVCGHSHICCIYMYYHVLTA